MVVLAHIPGISPEVVVDQWITPDLVCCWWSEEAETEPRLDGACLLAWPRMNWHLRGRYTAFEPGRRLGFTWAWDHCAGEPARVRVAFERHGDGTRMTVEHGPYPNGHGTHAEHIDGWTHFLGPLHALLAH